MIGLIYFLVIIFANALGAISGMGGGVIIKPIFDFVGAHSVAAISFYSSVAVFTMAIVSTLRQLKSGLRMDWKALGWISFGAVAGGFLGNIALDYLLTIFNEKKVNLIQIILTVLTLLFAFFYTKYDWKNFRLINISWYVVSGLVLGFLASLLGIGGGAINVSLLMLMFSMPIKEATVYSIGTIFFSQLAKILTIAGTTGFSRFDLTMLYFVVPAAVLGGLLGTNLSIIFSPKRVTTVFQGIIFLVLLINVYNAWQLFY